MPSGALDRDCRSITKASCGICWYRIQAPSCSTVRLSDADGEAHDIAVELYCSIVIHPPNNVTQRAFKFAALRCAPRPYLDRNKVIVRETTFLIAAPAMELEQLRSGT